MIACRQPTGGAEAIAGAAITRTWPMASPEAVARLVRASSVVENARGTLLAQGERPSRVALVLSGTFVGTWTAPDGRVSAGAIVDADPSGPGQVVGITTLRGAPIISGIDAVTPVTMLLWMSEEFAAITDSDPGLSRELLDRCIYLIQVLNHLVQLRTFTTAGSRLAGVMLQYETFCFGEAPLMGRGNLSALAGVSQRMVSRILRGWEAEGIVQRVGTTRLDLLDRSALEGEAAPLRQFPAPVSPRRRAPAS